MRKRALFFAVMVIAIFAIPVLASGLELDISISAEEVMAGQADEWYVKPGTYRGY